MNYRFFKIVLFFLLFLIFIGTNPKSLAQETNLEAICQSMEIINKECQKLSNKDCRSLLEKCEKYYQAKSDQYEKGIAKTQKEKKTLQNQIYLLRQKIKKLDSQIHQSNMMVKDVTLQIGDTESSIKKTSLEIEDLKKKLSHILRTIYEEDQKGIIEILLSEPEFSDFFDNLMALELLFSKNQEVLKEIKGLKSSLEIQKKSLEQEKEDLEKLLIIQQLQRQEGQALKKEQENLLEKTKGREKEYQKLLISARKKAQEIRKRIFELAGVPKAPTFGEALEIAKYAEKITGVRPAFLLAVLKQESNIGRNVGQCYLKNPQTGAGINIKTGQEISRVMKPGRDVQPFLTITQELGRDPYHTQVSCPMSFGWGGAMGPAQFIPSTWMLYKDRVTAITGKPADPWSIVDSFLAAALYLADYGATQRTPEAEWKAAMIYFSGTTNPKYSFYGNSVIAIAKGYEEDIEIIERKGLTQL